MTRPHAHGKTAGLCVPPGRPVGDRPEHHGQRHHHATATPAGTVPVFSYRGTPGSRLTLHGVTARDPPAGVKHPGQEFRQGRQLPFPALREGEDRLDDDTR